MDRMVALSVLDLCPIVEGGDAGQALRNSLDLARQAEAVAQGLTGVAAFDDGAEIED